MRTTVELSDELVKRAKIVAIERGTTLRELISQGLERELAAIEARNGSETVGEDGKLYITNQVIKDLEYQDDLKIAENLRR